LKQIETEWSFIDTPGTLDANVIELMQASDFVLVVLRYGQFELEFRLNRKYARQKVSRKVKTDEMDNQSKEIQV
jgi:broad-specificity NMP kinase